MNCIEVKNVFKTYKSHGENVNVLDGLNLTVGHGEIFSLIGASGCGKTTLFTCLMGMQKIDNGEMKIFNQKVNYNKSSKNYHAIGYMPQQIALINELTIEETLHYFGDLFMMNPKELNERISEIVDLLNLPDINCQIRNLSGGQRRRVSLAVAILHKPKLLLLDEPTVGLDYLLREKIWNFLRESTNKFNITVVITTHYIDEAKNSDRCGFLRNGRMIAQNTPAYILSQLECETLDEAFYNLSVNDEKTGRLLTSVDDKKDVVDTNKITEVEIIDRTRTRVVTALLKKEFHRIKRQPIEIFFLLLAPLFIINMSLLAFGTIPNNIKIGIINHEITVYNECSAPTNCTNLLISCTFIQDLDVKISRIYYRSLESAFQDLQEETLNGIIMIPENYSKSIFDENLKINIMQIYLDYKVYIVDLFIKMKVFDAFKSATRRLADSCVDKEIHEEMIQFNYLYEKMDFDFRNTFGVVGSFLVLFFVPLSYTSLLIHSHRFEGIWNRTLLSGVRVSEMILSHLLFSFAYSASITIIFLLSIYFQLNFKITENHWILAVTSFALTNLGFFLGILVSAAFDDFHVIYGTGVLLSWQVTMLSGLSWPIEGVHPVTKPLTEWSPITFAVKLFMNVLVKKLGIFDPPVYTGIIYIFGWIFAVLVILKILLSKKKFAREI